MYQDEIVAEVRQARETYAAQFGNDLEAMVRDLQAKEQASGRRVVSLPPKRPIAPQSATTATEVPA